MRKITETEELRQIQLEILDDIHGYCNQHSMTYFLSSGTLLGAVRHGGFIPWDDDIDIYMPRKDYDRFLTEYQGTHYEVLNPEQDNKYFFGFAKIVDTRTLMFQEGIDGFEFGVFVDVFPVDYVPEDEHKRLRVFYFKNLLYKIRRCKLAHNNPLTSRLAWHCYRWLPISVSLLNRMIRSIIVSKKPTGYVCNMSDGGPNIKCCFSAADIESSIDIAFEGRRYKTMVGYKDYLEHTYGDYMKLPPIEQRVAHHFDAYWLE